MRLSLAALALSSLLCGSAAAPPEYRLENELQELVPGSFLTGAAAVAAQPNWTMRFDAVAPTLLFNDGDWASMTVTTLDETGTPDADATAWVGLYTLPFGDLTQRVPVKYFRLKNTPGYMTSGSATLRFSMVNFRAPVGAVGFTGGTTNGIEIGSTTDAQAISYADVNLPSKLRVTPGDSIGKRYQVSWSSFNLTAPVVEWGTAPGVYSKSADGSTSHIARDALCGAPAITIGWHELGLVHTAVIDPVYTDPTSAPTFIYYRVGDKVTGVRSAEYRMRVPPPPGQAPVGRPLQIIAFADLGRGFNTSDSGATWHEYGRPAINTSLALAAAAARPAGVIDAVFHPGDISYAVGYLAVWDWFAAMWNDVAAARPYLVGVGNHESDSPSTSSWFNITDSGGECSVPTMTLYPGPAPATVTTPWFVYKTGLVTLVMISSEHDTAPGSPQYAWLEKELEAVNRTETPWVVLGSHRPMYIDSTYGGPVNSDLSVSHMLVKNLEPLLWRHRVNLGIYGHNHAVQRLGAIWNFGLVQRSVPTVLDVPDAWSGTPTTVTTEVALHDDPQATVHMVAGTGGAAFTPNNNAVPPPWSERVFFEYGYARLTVPNASCLVYEWVSNADVSGTLVRDRMVIWQDLSKPWVLPSDDDNGGMSRYVIAGITVGAVAGVAGIVIAARIIRRRKLEVQRWGETVPVVKKTNAFWGKSKKGAEGTPAASLLSPSTSVAAPVPNYLSV